MEDMDMVQEEMPKTLSSVLEAELYLPPGRFAMERVP